MTRVGTPFATFTTLFAVLALYAVTATSQQTAVCSNTPATGERISCIEGTESTTSIYLRLEGVQVSTSDADTPGIHAEHSGSKQISILLYPGSETIDGVSVTTKGSSQTSGANAHGIFGHHKGTGGISIAVVKPIIVTNGDGADGIRGQHDGSGLLQIDTIGAGNSDVVDIHTKGTAAHGIFGYRTGDSAGDLVINDTRSTIKTESDGSRGIFGHHDGSGQLRMKVRDANITTLGGLNIVNGNAGPAAGIYGRHSGSPTGDLVLDVGNTTIRTEGQSSYGIHADVATQGSADLDIDVRDSSITTTGQSAFGIDVSSSIRTGGIDMDVINTVINTSGNNANGIQATTGVGDGDVDLFLNNPDITTAGESADGVYLEHKGGIDIGGDLIIDAEGGSITTKNVGASGIRAFVDRTSSLQVTVDVDVRDLAIKTVATGGTYTSAHGIDVLHAGAGNTVVNAQGGSIDTKGKSSHGIDVISSAWNNGDVTVTTKGGHTITTSGANSSGIRVAPSHTGFVAITVDSVTASGANAHGVEVGQVSSGSVSRGSAVDDDGFRKQTVTVNGRVFGGTGEAAGVLLAGGGKVYIGPKGTVGAESGIAILATGDTPGDNQGDPPAKPKLLVDMNLNGRRVNEVIGDDYVINDGGETTIVVNNVKLHDGATGTTGNTAANGAWNVTMREEGVTVDRTDPANWIVTEAATGVVADRDFSAGDFNETERPRPPRPRPRPVNPSPPVIITPPPTPQLVLQPEPSGNTGTSGNSEQNATVQGTKEEEPKLEEGPEPKLSEAATEPETEPLSLALTEPETESLSLALMETYAPRSAIYETLPDLLLRLSGRKNARRLPLLPDSNVWARLSGGQGAVDPQYSTVGASYDFRRFDAQIGLNISLGERFDGWVAAHYVTGLADVLSPNGGGEIEARGMGPSLGIRWDGEGGFYAAADLSFTDYDIDVSSDTVGLLRAGVGGFAHSLGVEAGRRFAIGDAVSLAPRARLAHRRLAVDKFTDTVDARVSISDVDRLVGGLGVVAETTRHWDEEEFLLRGSLDLERTWSGAETVAQVSGEQLTAKAAPNSLLLGLSGVWRRNRLSFSAEVSTRSALGSDTVEYAGFLNLGVRF